MNMFRRKFLLATTAILALTPTLVNTAFAAPQQGARPKNYVHNNRTFGQGNIGAVVSVVGDHTNLEEFEKTIKVMTEQMHMNGIRFDVKAQHCWNYDPATRQFTRDEHSLRFYKDIVGICKKYGIKRVMANVGTIHPDLEETLFGELKLGWPVTPQTQRLLANAFADFVVDVNKEHPDVELLIQVGDEVTFNNQWPEKGTQLAQFMKEVRKAITEKKAKCKLLMGSVSMQERQQKYIRVKDFFAEFVPQNGLDKIVDGFTFHMHNYRPDLEWVPESNFYDTEDAINAGRKLNKPMYISSTGMHSFPRVLESGFKLDTPEKAQEWQEILDVRFLLRSWALTSDIDFYEARDRKGNGESWTNQSVPETEYGLMYGDRSLKPAGKALAEFIKTYRDHKMVSYGPMLHNNHHFEAVLEDPNGKKTYLRWCMLNEDVAQGFTMKPTAFDTPYQPSLLAQLPLARVLTP